MKPVDSLTGVELLYFAAVARGVHAPFVAGQVCFRLSKLGTKYVPIPYNPDRHPAELRKLKVRGEIKVYQAHDGVWRARAKEGPLMLGDTEAEAVMRAFIVSRLGNEIDETQLRREESPVDLDLGILSRFDREGFWI